MSNPIDRAIKCMWDRYGEPLTLADIAHSAILSKFHFCRIFSDTIGVSPRRYLSAVRIYQAKRMLVTTSMNVTDVSFAVGYNSLGSFTNHFTDSVGVSPSRFRRIEKGSVEPPGRLTAPTLSAGIVSGTLVLPRGHSYARVYVGVFKSAIVEGVPAAAEVFSVASGERLAFSLKGVPSGEWFAHAVAVAESADPDPWNRRVLLVSRDGPFRITDRASALARVVLRGKVPADLPILFALPDLEAGLDNPARRAAATVSCSRSQ